MNYKIKLKKIQRLLIVYVMYRYDREKTKQQNYV
jgi:hypothetical protein